MYIIVYIGSRSCTKLCRNMYEIEHDRTDKVCPGEGRVVNWLTDPGYALLRFRKTYSVVNV